MLGAAAGPAVSLALGHRPTFFKTQPHFFQRDPDGELAAVQVFLLLEFLLQLLQREIGVALQPTLQPLPDRRGELWFASRMMRNPFGLTGSSLMCDQLPNVAKTDLEPLRNLFLGLFAFLATLQNPASQVICVGFRHCLSRRRSFAELTVA